MGEAVIKTVELSRWYGQVIALTSVSLEIERGVTGLLGPNGAGKSTLLSVLTGAWAPDAGDVTLDGQPWTAWSSQARARLRAVVPQRSTLAFPFEVAEVVRMGALPHLPAPDPRPWWRRGWPLGRARVAPPTPARPRAEILVAEALAEVGLQDQAHQRYTTLSGGERQRVHLARALVQLGGMRAEHPRLLMLDEPTASLDLAAAVDALDLARRLTARGVGALVVLHDLNLASLFADRVVVLARGRVLAQGAPRDVLTADCLGRAYGVVGPVVAHPDASERPVVLPPAPAAARGARLSDPPQGDDPSPAC